MKLLSFEEVQQMERDYAMQKYGHMDENRIASLISMQKWELKILCDEARRNQYDCLWDRKTNESARQKCFTTIRHLRVVQLHLLTIK